MRLLLVLAFGELPGPRALTPLNHGRLADDPMGRGPVLSQCCDHEVIEPSEQPEAAPEPSAEELPARRFDAWRRRSAIGALATGVALGLKEIFQPTNIEPVITAEAPGEPPEDETRLRVVLDLEDPTKSVAYLPRTTGKPDPPPASPD
jgi:hypothetical protein